MSEAQKLKPQNLKELNEAMDVEDDGLRELACHRIARLYNNDNDDDEDNNNPPPISNTAADSTTISWNVGSMDLQDEDDASHVQFESTSSSSTTTKQPKKYYFYIGSTGTESLEEKLEKAQNGQHPGSWIELQYINQTAFVAAIYLGSRGFTGIGGAGGRGGGGAAGGSSIFSIGKLIAKKYPKKMLL